MDAPTMINELAQRILRQEPVTDEELIEAVTAMRSHRTGSVERKKPVPEFDMGGFFDSIPDTKPETETNGPS